MAPSMPQDPRTPTNPLAATRNAVSNPTTPAAPTGQIPGAQQPPGSGPVNNTPAPPAGANSYTSGNGVTWVNGQPWQAGNPVYDAMAGGQNQMGAAPTPIQIAPNLNSNDPNVITGQNFAYNQNVGTYQQDVNLQNNQAYQNYQLAYNNWLQGGAVGPAPAQPNYASFNQGNFDQAWQQGLQNGVQSGSALNNSINPGSVFANNVGTAPGSYAGGPTGTYSAGPAGQANNFGVNIPGTQPANGQTQGSGGGGGPAAPQYGSQAGGGQIQNGIQGGGSQNGFAGTSFPGQVGTTYGGFNNWGQPAEGNPYGYMTGQSSNGLNGMQFTSTGQAPGMFSQQPLSFGYGNMNPLNSNNSGSMSGLIQLLSMFGLG